MAIIAFYLGILIAMPSFIYKGFIFCLASILLALKLPIFRYLAIGFWGAFFLVYLSTPVDLIVSNKPAIVKGYVSSIIKENKSKISFTLSVIAYQDKKINQTLLVHWYNPKKIPEPGQLWQFKVKFKRPRNFANPGGFDYKGWLYSKGIYFTATVYKNQAHLINADPATKFWLLALRDRFAKIILSRAKSTETAGLVQALTLGIKSNLPTEWEQLFRLTGTSHLLAISGLHVGLLASLSFFLVNFLWRSKPERCLIIPAQRLAAVAAILVAFLYAGLAGFSLPTQRALIMVCCFLGRYVFYRVMSAWQALSLSAFIVLILEPKAVLMPGFYLSFGAVIALLFISSLVNGGWLKRIVVSQVACIIALMPFALYYFHFSSFIAIIANLIAIPLVGFIIVPVCLVTLLVIKTPIAPLLMTLCSRLASFLITFLKNLTLFDIFKVEIPVTHVWQVILMLSTIVLITMIPFKRLQWLGLVLLLPIFFPNTPLLNNGEVRIKVLDVGQGAANLIETKNHVLLYDTGTKFYSGNTLANIVILPLLKTKRINSIDMLVISHTDIDHRGGYDVIKDNLPINQLLINEKGYYKNSFYCHSYQFWQWDGVLFEFLPIREHHKRDNNNSCILKISNHYQSILLTGDIESSSEDYLLHHYKENLPATFLLVPHHGSQTSSSDPFIKAVKPRFAVISAGFNNRYHFPHNRVLQNYRNNRVQLYNTAYCGMVSWKMADSPLILKPKCYRNN